VKREGILLRERRRLICPSFLGVLSVAHRERYLVISVAAIGAPPLSEYAVIRPEADCLLPRTGLGVRDVWRYIYGSGVYPAFMPSSGLCRGKGEPIA
jgi:hypothetical protein